MGIILVSTSSRFMIRHLYLHFLILSNTKIHSRTSRLRIIYLGHRPTFVITLALHAPRNSGCGRCFIACVLTIRPILPSLLLKGDAQNDCWIICAWHEYATAQPSATVQSDVTMWHARTGLRMMLIYAEYGLQIHDRYIWIIRLLFGRLYD